jgi:hypothetical protein
MLIQASAMRQSIAISLFIFSIQFITKKEPLKYCICIIIAYFFHSSAIILLPIYLIGVLDVKINTVTGLIILLSSIALFLFGNLYLSFIQETVNSYFPQYQTYFGSKVEIASGAGLVFMGVLFLFVIYYSQFQNFQTNILFTLTIIGYLVIPIGLVIAMVSRIGLYFTPVSIVVYPLVINKMRGPFIKFFFIFFIIAFTVYTFLIFFNTEIFKRGYGIYRTIFSAT